MKNIEKPFHMKEEIISSPIRWAGSKKRLLNDILESFKKDREIYIEPFLGSRNSTY